MKFYNKAGVACSTLFEAWISDIRNTIESKIDNYMANINGLDYNDSCSNDDDLYDGYYDDYDIDDESDKGDNVIDADFTEIDNNSDTIENNNDPVEDSSTTAGSIDSESESISDNKVDEINDEDMEDQGLFNVKPNSETNTVDLIKDGEIIHSSDIDERLLTPMDDTNLLNTLNEKDDEDDDEIF